MVEHFSCLLDEKMSGEAMARLVLKKVNGKKILYRQSGYLSKECYVTFMTLHVALGIQICQCY